MAYPPRKSGETSLTQSPCIRTFEPLHLTQLELKMMMQTGHPVCFTIRQISRRHGIQDCTPPLERRCSPNPAVDGHRIMPARPCLGDEYPWRMKVRLIWGRCGGAGTRAQETVGAIISVTRGEDGGRRGMVRLQGKHGFCGVVVGSPISFLLSAPHSLLSDMCTRQGKGRCSH